MLTKLKAFFGFGRKPFIVPPLAPAKHMTREDITTRVTSRAQAEPHNYRHPHEETWPSGKLKRNKHKGHR